MSKQEEAIIISCFEQLWESLRQLCLHIHDQLKYHPVWIEENGVFRNNRDKVIYSLRLLTQKTDLTAQETWSCPGVVACTQETALLIQNVNQLKVQFKALIQDYKKRHDIKDTKVIRDLLAREGHSGLKLKQIYRQIHYISYQPNRIAWSKGRVYSNVILTKNQARHALLKTGKGINIDIQLAKLELLEPNEKLVKRIPIKSPWIVNITQYSQGDTYYQRLATSLPLFYLAEDKNQIPKICFAKPNKRNPKTTRSDQKIEDIPFLESIHTYRYKKGKQPMSDQALGFLINKIARDKIK